MTCHTTSAVYTQLTSTVMLHAAFLSRTKGLATGYSNDQIAVIRHNCWFIQANKAGYVRGNGNSRLNSSQSNQFLKATLCMCQEN